MSKSGRDRRDAERAARRAKRLAERAEERAKRKERHAERAAERAERLAEKAKRRPSRERDLDRSIEDLVDEVTQKAEEWIDEQTQRLFDTSHRDTEVERAEGQARRARREAERARASARRAEREAEDLSGDGEYYSEAGFGMGDMGFGDDMGLDDEDYGLDAGWTRKEKRRAKRKAKRRQRRYGYGRYGGPWMWHGRRRRRGNWYRDKENAKICGVCAGTAAYFGRPAWEIRLYAVLGLMFIPQVVIPTYFIMYFLLDDMPYYRRVTDRFPEGMDRRRDDREDERASRADRKMKKDTERKEPAMSNVQAMKLAKDKFSDIEQRLRKMETHVTSSRFELQREFKKISGED